MSNLLCLRCGSDDLDYVHHYEDTIVYCNKCHHKMLAIIEIIRLEAYDE